MFEHTESSYALLAVEHKLNDHNIDLFLPRHMLTRTQLVAGSEVLVQGLYDESSVLVLRASKGTENAPKRPYSFIATLRFPNTEKVLQRFLASSTKQGIIFTSIRTHGSRGQAEAEVLCEGALTDIGPRFDEALGVAKTLTETARLVNGTVVSCARLSFEGQTASHTIKKGRVLPSTVWIDTPILRGNYGKIRVNTQTDRRPLKAFENALVPVRVELDGRRMILALDLQFSQLSSYVLVFSADQVRPYQPVTEGILEVLIDEGEELDQLLNVDAVEAFEYQRYKPGLGALTLTGRVEMLITSRKEIQDLEGVRRRLAKKIAATGWTEESEIRLYDVGPTLRRYKHLDREEDKRTLVQFLNDGIRKWMLADRFVFVEPLSSGGFANVCKYIDIRTGLPAAGKHIRQAPRHADTRQMLANEIAGLEIARRNADCRHLAKILDHFYDDDFPVLMMEYVQYVLAGHYENGRYEDQYKGALARPSRHRTPASLLEFSEMALQLLEALRFLHNVAPQATSPIEEQQGNFDGEGMVHGDIKAANIGYDVEEGHTVWKLLDFGMAKFLEEEGETTRRWGGTPGYMSPQAIQKEKYRSNDIYSLGVVFFEVLNGWRHPGTIQPLEDYDDYVAEVGLYLARGRANGPQSRGSSDFNKDRWQLSSFFQEDKLPTEADRQLRDIIYTMMALDHQERPSTAGEVHEQILAWKTKYLLGIS